MITIFISFNEPAFCRSIMTFHTRRQVLTQHNRVKELEFRGWDLGFESFANSANCKLYHFTKTQFSYVKIVMITISALLYPCEKIETMYMKCPV